MRRETELSPYVQKYWEDRGYCVHGEVAVYGKAVFVDHVAHLGPCEAPTYVVAIEMKKGATKALRSQLRILDRRHVADEIWGAVFSEPRQATIAKWKEFARWINPGLLVWKGEGFEKVVKSAFTGRKNHPRYQGRNKYQLLLVPENKGVVAGHKSGEQEYHTHWSLGCSYIKSFARGVGTFTTEECYRNLPPHMRAYRKPRAAMRRMLRYLEEGGEIEVRGKEGRFNKYAAVVNREEKAIGRMDVGTNL